MNQLEGSMCVLRVLVRLTCRCVLSGLYNDKVLHGAYNQEGPHVLQLWN